MAQKNIQFGTLDIILNLGANGTSRHESHCAVPGGFLVEMQRQSAEDRMILCRYNPRETGDYVIDVKWSGEHVPGSPFQVFIASSREMLERYKMEIPRQISYRDQRAYTPSNGRGQRQEYYD